MFSSKVVSSKSRNRFSHLPPYAQMFHLCSVISHGPRMASCWIACSSLVAGILIPPPLPYFNGLEQNHAMTWRVWNTPALKFICRSGEVEAEKRGASFWSEFPMATGAADASASRRSPSKFLQQFGGHASLSHPMCLCLPSSCTSLTVLWFGPAASGDPSCRLGSVAGFRRGVLRVHGALHEGRGEL